MILERKKINEAGPIVSPVFCLEAQSEPEARKGITIRSIVVLLSLRDRI